MTDATIICGQICLAVVFVSAIAGWVLCYPRYLFHKETEAERERSLRRDEIHSSNFIVSTARRLENQPEQGP